MKKSLSFWVLLVITGTALTSCQTAEMATPASPAAEDPAAEEAYPVGYPLGYPVESETGSGDIAIQDWSYPVSEESLVWLNQTWSLSAYAENNQVVNFSGQTITFAPDGSYERTQDGVTATGTWTTQVTNDALTLTLDPGSGQVQMLEIVDLQENRLFLRYAQEGILIEEQYLPVD